MRGINWEDMTPQEAEEMRIVLEKERQKAEKSYDKNPSAERKYCPYCQQLLPYGSMAYGEGYHFDTCE